MIDRRAFILSTAAAPVAGSFGISNCDQLALDRSASAQAARRDRLVPPADGSKIKVACGLSSGVTLIDWDGPAAVFGAWLHDEATNQDRPLFEVLTVGESREIKEPGFNVIPDYTYDDAPQVQIVVVPAQAGSPRFYEWLKQASVSADLTMSVCIGARHLAKLGLLDGQVATTHHDFIKPYTEEFPKVRWVAGQRFVEGPKIATSAGVTSGFDLALRVYERYFGREKAAAAARVIEYEGTRWMV